MKVLIDDDAAADAAAVASVPSLLHNLEHCSCFFFAY
jgi:hypothetical protein